MRRGGRSGRGCMDRTGGDLALEHIETSAHTPLTIVDRRQQQPRGHEFQLQPRGSGTLEIAQGRCDDVGGP